MEKSYLELNIHQAAATFWAYFALIYMIGWSALSFIPAQGFSAEDLP
jgi:hypothetical protein